MLGRSCPGDTLDFRVQGEEVTLRPRRSPTPLQKERGIWVLRTGKPMTGRETEELLRSVGEEPVRKGFGENP